MWSSLPAGPWWEAGVLGVRPFRLLSDRRAQNTVEYLLVVGVIVVLVALAFMTNFPSVWSQFIGFLCPSVDPVGSSGPGQCLGG